MDLGATGVDVVEDAAEDVDLVTAVEAGEEVADEVSL